MNLTFVSEFFPASESGELRGGTEARLFYITRELAGRHAITVLTAFEEGMARESLLFDGAVRVRRCGPVHSFVQSGALLPRLRFSSALSKMLRESSGDVVDAQNFLAYTPVWRSGRAFRVRVATVHDVWRGRWMKLFGMSGLIGELYERYALTRNWDGLVANSIETADRLKQFVSHAERIRVVYNGIESSLIEKKNPKKFSAPTVTFVGRLVEYKRVQDLILALPQVQKTIPEAELHIIGVGSYEGALQALVRKEGIHGAHFLGHIPHHQAVLEHIAKSHIFSLPSVIEGFGMVTLEAMALGVPFVNADIAVTREVTAGQGGVFFPPTNSSILAEKLVQLYRDAQLRERLGHEGRERSMVFHWDVLARQTELLYTELLSP